jgi:hypothetical protein
MKKFLSAICSLFLLAAIPASAQNISAVGVQLGGGTTYYADSNQIIHMPAYPAAFGGIGSPSTRSLSQNTAYQATNSSLGAIEIITISSSAAVTISGGATNTANILVGTTSGVATGTGTTVASYSNSMTGTLVVGVSVTNGSNTTFSIFVPAGQYFSINSGSGSVSIVSVIEQSIG